jgi:hypothetical protein
VDTVLVASAQWILAAAIHSVHHPAILLKLLLANVVGVRKVESVHQATIVSMWLGYKNVDQTRKVLTQTKDALLVLSDGEMLLLLAHQIFQKEILAQVRQKSFVHAFCFLSKSCQSHVKVMRCINFYTSILTFRGCFLANCSSRSTGSDKDDGHTSTAMDYTECCRAQCTDLYTNCDAVDSTMTVRNGKQCYPNAAGECAQTECCYTTDCEAWGLGGGTCSGDKVVRSDQHGCSEGACDAGECCRDPDGCNADPTKAASGKCKCGGALCNDGQYCWDGTTCNDAAKPSDGGGDGGDGGDDATATCSVTDGSKATPWTGGTAQYEECTCTGAGGCTTLNVCDVAKKTCVCTPGKDHWCYESAKVGEETSYAVKFGCFAKGDNKFKGWQCVGDNVLGAHYSDAACTTHITPANGGEDETFSATGRTSVKKDDDGTVQTEEKTTITGISTCKGGVAGAGAAPPGPAAPGPAAPGPSAEVEDGTFDAGSVAQCSTLAMLMVVAAMWAGRN